MEMFLHYRDSIDTLISPVQIESPERFSSICLKNGSIPDRTCEVNVCLEAHIKRAHMYVHFKHICTCTSTFVYTQLRLCDYHVSVP